MQAQDLHGVWLIQSFHVEDQGTGQRTEPWGERPRGTVLFHPGGRMFALITADDRPPPDTPEAQARSFQAMLAYSGPYRLDPPNRLVTSVDISWFDPWLGTDQVRYCELRGDDLRLTSAPLSMPEGRAPVHAVVTWKRELASQASVP